MLGDVAHEGAGIGEEGDVVQLLERCVVGNAQCAGGRPVAGEELLHLDWGEPAQLGLRRRVVRLHATGEVRVEGVEGGEAAGALGDLVEDGLDAWGARGAGRGRHGLDGGGVRSVGETIGGRPLGRKDWLRGDGAPMRCRSPPLVSCSRQGSTRGSLWPVL